MDDAGDLRDYLAVAIAAGIKNPAASAHRRYHIPRPSISRELRRLVEAGVLKPIGRTKSRRYEMQFMDVGVWTAPVEGSKIDEDELWRNWVADRLSDCPENVRNICHYGFTEMVNNVVDHSETQALTFRLERSLATVKLSIYDDGIGIFRKLQRDLGFGEKREAIFELSKGKLTTDPARHTGEGIFFTTRLFDVFMLSSDELGLGRYWGGKDMLLEDIGEPVRGTLATMTLRLNSRREMKEVFDHYSAVQDDYAFATMDILVNLARTGTEQLVSRSQAKRLLARFQQFRELILDFKDVNLIGPAFADEIFRVFKTANPSYRVQWVNANQAVERMIRRAISASQARVVPDDNQPVE